MVQKNVKNLCSEWRQECRQNAQELGIMIFRPGGGEEIGKGVTEGVGTDGDESAIDDVGERSSGRTDSNGNTALRSGTVIIEVHLRGGLVTQGVLRITDGFGIEVFYLVDGVVEVYAAAGI